MACNTVIRFIDLHEWNATFIAKQHEKKLIAILLFDQLTASKPLLMIKYTDLYCWNDSIVKEYRISCEKKWFEQRNVKYIYAYRYRRCPVDFIESFGEAGALVSNTIKYLQKCVQKCEENKFNFSIIGDNAQINYLNDY